MQILCFLSVGSKFAKFLISFFKTQVSFSSQFAPFFSIMTNNSSVLFWLKHNIFDKNSTSECKFSNLPLLALKFTKFLMVFLETRVRFSSNFVSLFSVMRQNSSVFFQLKRYMHWTKGAHQSPHFLTFDCLHEN